MSLQHARCSDLSNNIEMKSLKDNPVVQYRPETLQEVRKLFDLDKPGTMDQCIDILQDWIQKQPHFNKKVFDRDFLERCIIRAKGSVEKAKHRLESICEAITLYPDYFAPVRANTVPNLKTIDEAILPKQTADFCSIYFLRNREQIFLSTFFCTYYRRAISIFEYIYRCDYNAGMIFILDYTECNLPKLITSLGSPYIRLSSNFIMKSIGARFHSMHIISNSKILQALVAALQPFLGDKMTRIHLHKNIESVYKHIDKDLLPADYGGKEEPLHVLAKNMLDFLSSDEMYNNLKDSASATIDTSIKQLEKDIELDFGTAGTFRSLNVD